MPIYKVTACYYDTVEVEAESEVDAEREAWPQFDRAVSSYGPDDILIEELSDDYDDEDDEDDEDEEWTQ